MNRLVTEPDVDRSDYRRKVLLNKIMDMVCISKTLERFQTAQHMNLITDLWMDVVLRFLTATGSGVATMMVVVTLQTDSCRTYFLGRGTDLMC